MTTFSVTQAYGTGFRLITRKPAQVVAWGLAYLLIYLAPILLMLLAFGPAMLSPTADTGLVATIASSIGQSLTGFTAIVANAVIYNAIYRAVLTPQDDRGLYMRFGIAEVWQALVQVLYGVIVGFGFVIGILCGALFAGGGALLAGAGGGGGGIAVAVVLGIISSLVFLSPVAWVALRLSLASPMTLADRNFRLFESWALTRGHTWRLFQLMLLTALTSLVLVLVVIGVIALVFGFWGMAGMPGPTEWGQYFTDGPGAAAVVPLILGSIIVAPIVYGVVQAILIAPWADAYRQLRPPTVDAETFA